MDREQMRRELARAAKMADAQIEAWRFFARTLEIRRRPVTDPTVQHVHATIAALMRLRDHADSEAGALAMRERTAREIAAAEGSVYPPVGHW